MDAALVDHVLGAAILQVEAFTDERIRAVVAGEDDERVPRQFKTIKLVHQGADPGVHDLNHGVDLGGLFGEALGEVTADDLFGCTQRPVRRIVGEVQEERPVTMTAHKVDGAAREFVGEIRALEVTILALDVEAVSEVGLDVRAVIEAGVFIEAAPERMVGRAGTGMPLAHQPGGVSVGLEAVRDGGFVEVQAGEFGELDLVEGDRAGAVGIPAGEQRRA